jgi:hypothetical protein
MVIDTPDPSVFVVLVGILLIGGAVIVLSAWAAGRRR